MYIVYCTNTVYELLQFLVLAHTMKHIFIDDSEGCIAFIMLVFYNSRNPLFNFKSAFIYNDL